MSKSIPVLAYHSIAASEKMKPSRFETHLQVLIRSKLPSLLPKDLVSAKRGFLLTFDDGFADFWTHVFPLLEQYGVRAVVFVIPSRTGTGDCRPQGKRAFQDNANQAHQEAGEQKGPHDAFLRWAELEAMEQSGLVEVQSHTTDSSGNSYLTGYYGGSEGVHISFGAHSLTYHGVDMEIFVAKCIATGS